MARSKWTRQTYVMVADALNSEYRKSGPDAQVGILNAACELADRFRQDNPSFDSARFFEAVEAR